MPVNQYNSFMMPQVPEAMNDLLRARSEEFLI